MTGYQNRNRFIPFRKTDIIEMCISDSRLSEHDQNLFRQFCHILGSLIHFEFHHQVEMLKDCYSPFNPDADTRLNYDYPEQEKKALQKKLVEGLAAILNAANFQKITEADLEEALKEESLFKIRKIKFMKALSDNLYFKNLDNNTGVFHHLVDAAEEEEFKEAILAYYFLLGEDKDLTTTELDETVERWFEKKHNCRINFEIEDALQKLLRWNLVNQDGKIIRRKNLNDAMQQLDKIWDNYFPYHIS